MSQRANPADRVLRRTIKASLRSPGSPATFVGTIRFVEEQPLADPTAQAHRDAQWTTYARRLAGIA
jgi:hypothetical protein